MDERKEMEVFVKIDDYKDIVDIINLTRAKLKQAKFIIGKIEDLKKREDEAIAKWIESLAEVEEKVNFVDESLFEPQV